MFVIELIYKADLEDINAYMGAHMKSWADISNEGAQASGSYRPKADGQVPCRCRDTIKKKTLDVEVRRLWAGAEAAAHNFLGHSPGWYKTAVATFLLLNPVLLLVAGPFVAGWVLLLEFIFTLAMALRCYPLQPGGLLAPEAIVRPGA